MSVFDFLREHHVQFRSVQHQPALSAQRVAHCLHLPGNTVAKIVVLKADEKYVLAVLPASHSVDLPRAQDALAAKNIALACEDELRTRFADCAPGTVPPFGSRYGVGTLVDESLTHAEFLVFEGGSHAEAVCVRYHDFEAVEDPLVSEFSHHL